MEHKLVVLEWLYKADQDFGYAGLGLADESGYYDQICFLLQQAVEKYLKAYIVANDLKFAKEHSLVKLLDECVRADISLDKLQSECRFLTAFYFEVRYPDEPFIVATKEQAEKALKAADAVQTEIRKRLGIEGEVTAEMVREEDKKVEEEMKIAGGL